MTSSTEYSTTDSDTIYGLRRCPIPAENLPSPQAGSRIARWILRCLGWHTDFPGFPTQHGLIVVYPHTSNWDFPLGVLYKWAHGIPLRFWIKHTPTEWPVIGRWIKWVGGVPINRTASHGVVADTLKQMQHSHDLFWLVVAPEGTRSYTNGWRTGFYHVWQASQCPLGLATIDFARKRIGLTEFVYCSGDMQADFAALAQYYTHQRGYHPEQQAPVRPYVRHVTAPAPSQQQ